MLTPKMKEFIENQLAWVSTVDNEGNPNLGPKRSTRVFDENHLIFNENTMGHHAANIEANGKIVVAYANWEKLQGIRFIGKAKLYRDGEIFAAATEWAKGKMGPPKGAVVIEIERIENIASGPKAGTPWIEE